MHELSIADSIAKIATEEARNADAEKVESITIRVGALSCIQKETLEFSFGMIAEGTWLEGTELIIIEVPVSIFCATCDQEVVLQEIQCLRCPICDTPSADIRQGQELDIDSIAIIENAHVCSEQKHD